MARPSKLYSFWRGEYGDLLLNSGISQDIGCVDHMDNIVINDITEAIEIIVEQGRYTDTYARAIGDLSIKGQVLRSLENARDLMSVCRGTSISVSPRRLPPPQEDMVNFLKKWRKKRPKP